MHRLQRCVWPNEALQSKPCTLHSCNLIHLGKKWISDFTQALGGFPLSPSFCACSFWNTHQRDWKTPQHEQWWGFSDQKDLSVLPFPAGSVPAGRDYPLGLSQPSLLRATERNITSCLENIPAIPHIPVYLFLQENPLSQKHHECCGLQR